MCLEEFFLVQQPVQRLQIIDFSNERLVIASYYETMVNDVILVCQKLLNTTQIVQRIMPRIIAEYGKNGLSDP